MSFLRVLRATSRKKLILILATEERTGPLAPAPALALGPSSPGEWAGRVAELLRRQCREQDGPQGHVAGGDCRTQGVERGGGGRVSQAPPPLHAAACQAPFPRM